MGKVLSVFGHGRRGAISRSVDDVVIALSNKEYNNLDFGEPVVLNNAGTGAVKFTSSSTAADFVGVTVRSASKTPESYGDSVGSYAPGEMMDVITRGSVIVEIDDGTPVTGGPVYIIKASGKFTAQADGDNTLELTNAKFRSGRDGAYLAEIVLLSRNKQ